MKYTVTQTSVKFEESKATLTPTEAYNLGGKLIALNTNTPPEAIPLSHKNMTSYIVGDYGSVSVVNRYIVVRVEKELSLYAAYAFGTYLRMLARDLGKPGNFTR